MELDPIYAGEGVTLTFDLDTSVTDPEYDITGMALTFRVGSPGGVALIEATGTAVVAADGTCAVLLTAQQTGLPEGRYPWQLMGDSMLLAEGTVPVRSLIAQQPSVELVVGTDSYLSVADADAILAKRLNVEPWQTASVDDKARALVMATEAIDSLMLVGFPLVESQPLEFPRLVQFRPGTGAYLQSQRFDNSYPRGMVNIGTPDAVKKATALEAVAILDDPEGARLKLQAQGVRSVNMGGVSETYRAADLLSHEAKRIMRDYTARSGAIV